MYGFEVLYDGEHCVICGATVEGGCGHFLTDEEFVGEFADGLPYTLANLVREIAEEDERALIEAAPTAVRSMLDAAAPDEDGEPNLLYWTTYPGVVAAFFAGDRPVGKRRGVLARRRPGVRGGAQGRHSAGHRLAQRAPAPLARTDGDHAGGRAG